MAAARRAIRAKQAGNQVIVVVSARGDTTDELIELAREISEQPPAREMDMLLSTGEQISIALMAMAIQALGRAGHQLHRRPGRHRHRQHAHQGPHQEHLHGPHAPGAGRGPDRHRRRLPGHRRELQHHHARPRRLRHHRRRPGRRHEARPGLPRQRRRSTARSTPTWTASTPPTRASCPRRARSTSSATTRCWSWPASAPASCTRAASSSPRSSTCRCRCASSFSDVEGTWIVPEADWMREVVVCGAAIVEDEARVALDGVPDRAGRQPSRLRGHRRAEHRRGHDRPERRQRRPGAIGFTVPGNELPATLAVLRPLAAELGATRRARRGGQQGVDRRHRHADAHRRRRDDVRRPGRRRTST